MNVAAVDKKREHGGRKTRAGVNVLKLAVRTVLRAFWFDADAIAESKAWPFLWRR